MSKEDAEEFRKEQASFVNVYAEMRDELDGKEWDMESALAMAVALWSMSNVMKPGYRNAGYKIARTFCELVGLDSDMTERFALDKAREAYAAIHGEGGV
jgi:hypothetical protein